VQASAPAEAPLSYRLQDMPIDVVVDASRRPADAPFWHDGHPNYACLSMMVLRCGDGSARSVPTLIGMRVGIGRRRRMSSVRSPSRVPSEPPWTSTRACRARATAFDAMAVIAPPGRPRRSDEGRHARQGTGTAGTARAKDCWHADDGERRHARFRPRPSEHRLA
jgi:hypothetical protein